MSNSDIIAVLVVRSTVVRPSLKFSIPNNRSRITLRFSHEPRDLTLGFCFGRDEKRCDVCFNSISVSRLHFRIDLGQEPGRLVLYNESAMGSRINSKKVPSQRQSSPLSTGDIIEGGPIQLQIRLPKRIDCYEEYKQNWRLYLEQKKKSAPKLSCLSLQRETLVTVPEPHRLSLVDHSDESRIRQATDSRGTLFAVKLVSRYREVLQKIGTGHPNIVPFCFEKIVDPQIPYLVMEWVENESLAKASLLTSAEITTVIAQVLSAAEYFHHKGIVHREIQPSNVLITSRKPLVCKLGGFGGQAQPPYRAPELILRKKYLSNDFSSDVWSIGMMILQFSLFGPWTMRISNHLHGRCFEDQVSRPGPRWQALTTFANTMLDPDMAARPSATQCLEGISCLDVTQADSSSPAANLAWLSRRMTLPYLGSTYKALLPLIKLDPGFQGAALPYIEACKVLQFEAKETDVELLMRRDVIKHDGQELVALQHVTQILLCGPKVSAVDAGWGSGDLGDDIENVHLAKLLPERRGRLSWF